jgi:hypothetical protein
MGTYAARQALDDNLKRHLSPETNPAMYNLCVALKDIARALDDLERKIDHVAYEVRNVADRQR